jgi:esterase/lipase superfamily enzyme
LRLLGLALLPCALLLVLAAGCGGRELIPTPNLYVGSGEDPFAAVPEPFQNNQVDVLYATDRTRVETDGGSVQYDYGRSYSLAFGSATMTLGEDVPWEALVAASRTDDREVSLPLSLARVEEKGRFPATPLPLVDRQEGAADPQGYGDNGVPDPAALARHAEVAEALRSELRERLALTPVKEAYVFVHGYNNTFEDAVSVIAELWHFLGRQGVPIAYTWPAGIGGLRGYLYDRESGEFTIFHLKDFLRILRSCEELEKIHLIAHSRGTDVLLSALRELWIEVRHAPRVPGRPPRKLGHIILAAPDLDVDVLSQRFGAEEFAAAIYRGTIYMSRSDVAIGLSSWLWGSRKRMGRVGEGDLNEIQQQRTKHMHNVTLIDSRVDTGFIGHSYFYSHPAVLSDLILILRDDRLPGAENGRPLGREGGSVFWSIDDDYPEIPAAEG